MLLTNPIDPETQTRQALARVYALLLRLAEDENKTVDSDNLGGAALSTAEQIDPKKESIHE
ncbi:MAG: hypothetical protein IT310_15320 [Anaerolineales bacterium]|nr:hypothetical protein [Anaerolineales bacterium]